MCVHMYITRLFASRLCIQRHAPMFRPAEGRDDMCISKRAYLMVHSREANKSVM